MIKIDPLYLLLFIELSCILAGGVVFLLIRLKKYRIHYQSTLKDRMEADRPHEELRKPMIIAQGAAPAAAVAEAQKPEPLSADDAKKLEELRTKLHEVEEELSEKNHLLEQLQAKFAGLEKEYTVLYQQQQNQQAKKGDEGPKTSVPPK
jgi:chromosome segregation ATPase